MFVERDEAREAQEAALRQQEADMQKAKARQEEFERRLVENQTLKAQNKELHAACEQAQAEAVRLRAVTYVSGSAVGNSRAARLTRAPSMTKKAIMPITRMSDGRR